MIEGDLADEASGGNLYVCKVRPEMDSCMRQVILHRPDAHPAWDNYWLTLIHLRTTPKQGEAVKEDADCTHEIAMYALHPDHEPEPNNPDALQIMTPVNLSVQLRGLGDREARKVFSQFLSALADKRMSPDTDYRRLQQSMIARLCEIMKQEN